MYYSPDTLGRSLFSAPSPDDFSAAGLDVRPEDGDILAKLGIKEEYYPYVAAGGIGLVIILGALVIRKRMKRK